ncbi:DNA cytosine methyltransferase [Catenulispora subtropica]|uniref:DNA cytosine methyltransferase n=1 Tax=Catenulispora subtropica TaxID=450798 RepID=UPI003CD0781C
MPPQTRPEPPQEAGTSIELFAGAGGLALAMHQARFRHLLAVEVDERACETLRLNGAKDYSPDQPRPTTVEMSWPLVCGDVREFDFKPWKDEVDVVAGGVPCQPWSLGGVHRGYEDKRNLWPELLRCVRETRPKAIVAENVKGLLRPSFRPYYDYILRQLELPHDRATKGEDWSDHDARLRARIASIREKRPDTRALTRQYDVHYQLLNAADYGVPQTRHRVFVVAFRKDLGLSEWDFPAPTHSEIELAASKADHTYWIRHGMDVREMPAQEELDLGGGGQRLAPWKTIRDALRDVHPPLRPLDKRLEHPKWIHHRGWPGAREYKGHRPNEWDHPAKTIKAGVHGVAGGENTIRLDDGEIRYLTVREVARLMTFPDNWRLEEPRSEQMRQLGNAVPVELGRVVAQSVADALWTTGPTGRG